MGWRRHTVIRRDPDLHVHAPIDALTMVLVGPCAEILRNEHHDP